MSDRNFNRFSGASRYVLDAELAKIVNVSMALEMPLLLKGEPGTGKTMKRRATWKRRFRRPAPDTPVNRPCSYLSFTT